MTNHNGPPRDEFDRDDFDSIVAGIEYSQPTEPNDLDRYLDSVASLHAVIGKHLDSAEKFDVKGLTEVYGALRDAAEEFSTVVTAEDTSRERLEAAASLLRFSLVRLRAFYSSYVGESSLTEIDDIDDIQVALDKLVADYRHMEASEPYKAAYLDVHKDAVLHLVQCVSSLKGSEHVLNHTLPVGKQVHQGRFQLLPDQPLA